MTRTNTAESPTWNCCAAPPSIFPSLPEEVVRQFSRVARCRPDVATGEILVVCGPSGSGKSTLIRCINLLEDFQKGQILVDGSLPAGRKGQRRAQRDGHGVPELQPVSAPDGAGNVTLAPTGARRVPRGGKTRPAPWSGWAWPSMRTNTGPVVGRPAAAGGDCPGPGHEPQGNAV